MVYITQDGRVVQNQPWSLGRIGDIFWGAVNFVTQFFQSLFGFTNGQSITGNRRGGGGGGGSGGNGPGGGPGGRPPRQIKTMKEIRECNMAMGG